ncbi:MAG: hypothetical protein CL674_06380 [Bdellovibrionaceae bacterium]|mgnify:CR=1 FL=1|nr:hypothetical protein [Pseudobdellovibrionaceae bacterium]|tara:strand:+ start:7410 stop:7835 length:426 start_codon:yes stop_codon:yes gene_type:complete
MSKIKALPVITIITLILVLSGIALYFYYRNHPRSLDRRLHFAKRDIQKLKSTEAKCFSVGDCRMEILKTQECVPVDWIVGYSRRDENAEEIEKLIRLYDSLYDRRYGKDYNKECARANAPKLRCLKGKCVVRIYQGQILSN